MNNGIVLVFAVLGFSSMIYARPQDAVHRYNRPWYNSQRSPHYRRSIPQNIRTSYGRYKWDFPSLDRRPFDDQNTQRNRAERSGTLSPDDFKPRRSSNGTTKILTLSSRGKRGSESSSDTFVFPGPIAGDAYPTISKSSCGSGRTFCEDVENYPVDYIEGILSNSANEYGDLLGVDELMSPEIDTRIDLTRDFELCRSSEQIVYPKEGITKDDKWLFIINIPSHTQGVRVEVCQGNNEPCEFSHAFPIGYNSSCQQKYIYRKLVGLRDGNPVVDTFKLPSCCSCIVSNPTGISSRSNFSPARSKVDTTTTTTTKKPN